MMLATIILQKIKGLLRLAPTNQKGQSIIIITFAFIGLLAMLGLALDLGLVYVERTRLKRAVDAAVLAGVSELPGEESAFIQTINYLNQNGYSLRNSNGVEQINIYIRGCSHDSYLGTDNFQNYHDDTTNSGNRPTIVHDNATYYLYYPASGKVVDDPKAEFFIDTRSFQSTDSDGDFEADNQQCDDDNALLGTAGKIQLNGSVPVDMSFMQFFGFSEVPVQDEAIAQNVTNLDVAVVFDISGSMQFDTICYGCYEMYGDGTTSWKSLDLDPDFPDPDFIHPIPTDHLPATSVSSSISGVGENEGQLCAERDDNLVSYYNVTSGSTTRRYIIIEAELYSKNSSILAGPFREPGRGFWAIQHTNYRTIGRMEGSTWDPSGTYSEYSTYGVGATPILPTYTRSSWVSHHPYVTWSIEDEEVPFGHNYTLAEVQENPTDVPSLEYDFITSGQPGMEWNDNGSTYIWIRAQGGYASDSWSANRNLTWALYEYDDLQTDGAEGATPLNGSIQAAAGTPSYGAAYDGADDNRWKWIQLNSSGLNLTDTVKTKYTLKIWAGGVGYDIDQIVIGNNSNTDFTTGYSSGTAATAQATPGSAFREACNRCNPIYGLTVDQAGCVLPVDNGKSTVSEDDTDLSDPDKNLLFSDYQPLRGAKEALKRFIRKLDPKLDQVGIATYSSDTLAAGRVELRCRRYYSAEECFQGTNPISFTDVLKVVEKVPPSGSTNMGGGMLKALEMLGVNADGKSSTTWAELTDCDSSTDHCSRGSAARRIMIVMTDGIANVTPNSTCYADYANFTGDTTEKKGKACAYYYAQIAANNNITIYTIGLGNGVDTDFLETLATLPGSDGAFYSAVSTSQLDTIFDTILNSIAVRLIQ